MGTKNESQDPGAPACVYLRIYVALPYSVLVCLRNQPLETQCWILAQFLS